MNIDEMREDLLVKNQEDLLIRQIAQHLADEKLIEPDEQIRFLKLLDLEI